MDTDEIPTELWRHVCESVHWPVAFMHRSGVFIWANLSFSRLVGYAVTDLQSLSWMDISISTEIESTRNAINDLLHGSISRISKSKQFRHHRGHPIQVDIIMWLWPQFPSDPDESLLVFEAIPPHCTKDEIDKIISQTEARFEGLRKRITKLEERETMRNRQQHGDSQIVNVGNHTNSNSEDSFRGTNKMTSETVKLLVGVLVVLAGVIMYLGWLATWPHHKGQAPDPHGSQIERKIRD